MSRIDMLSGKRANSANSRSHSNIASRRKQNVNLQTIRLDGKSVRVSTRTIRSLKRAAAMAHGEIKTKMQKKAAKTAARAAAKK